MYNSRLSLFSYITRVNTMKHGFWNESGGSIPRVSVSAEKDKTKQARKYLNNIKYSHIIGISSDSSADFVYLEELLVQANKENDEKKQELFKLLDDAIEDKKGYYSTEDKTELNKLRMKLNREYISTKTKKNENKTIIVGKSKPELSKAKLEYVYINLLANLNNDGYLDNEIRDFIGEQTLKRTLSQVSEGGKNIDKVYAQVTGKTPDWTNPKQAAKIFHEALRLNIALLREFTDNGDIGLYAILTGKTKDFIQEAKEKNVKNEKKSDKESSTTYNTVGAAVSVGVAVGTGGLVAAGSEEHQMEADMFIEDFKSQGNEDFGKETVSVLNWAKEAYMGRKLSLTLGRERAREFAEKAAKYTKEVMKLTKDVKLEDVTDIRLKSDFITVLDAAQKAGIDVSVHFEQIQKILIQAYIINEGVTDQGSSYSASVGILMLVGIHKDTVEMNAKKGESTENSTIEKAHTKKTLDKETYEESGIKVEHIDKKWIYTIPNNVQMKYDDKPYPVVSPFLTLNEQGNYIYTSDVKEQALFSHDGEKYILSFSPVKNSEPLVQTSLAVVNFRVENLASKYISEKLFFIGHNKDFEKFVKLLGRQDFDGAREWLENMSKKGKYRTLAKKLLADKTPIETWSSYMYGSSESRSKQAYTQKYADEKVRTKATIHAEERLAKALKITLPSKGEEVFRIGKDEKFIPVQASVLFPNQEMTIACFSTPIDFETKKKGAHRLDTYDGSVTVMSKTALVTDPAQKESIIRAILANTSEKKAVQYQLDKLNSLIQGKGVVTMDAYISYLISGDINILGVSGLSLQPGKESRVFEGRAMIAGNVCLNRLFGITYPSFSPQGMDSVVAMDAVAVLNKLSTKATVSALGINTIGAAANRAANGSSTPAISTTGGGGNAGGNITPPAGNPVI
ncbi:MAG: hypothetical protein PHQ95_04190 [Candidatus Gracilibacteria bacterium]|nr:hypothetical protein [Candidatus Gracilibacteria bacterium]